MKKNKAPPKKIGRARTKRPNPPAPATPIKPRQQSRVAKKIRDKKVRVFEKNNPRYLNELYLSAYHKACWMCKSAGRTVVLYGEEFHTILRFVVIILEFYRGNLKAIS